MRWCDTRCQLFLCLFYIIHLGASVDRSSFKTCSQSGFCRRQRATKETSYELSNLAQGDNGLTADLTNAKNGVQFNLEVLLYLNNVVRIKVTETSPLKPRYVPDTVLNTQLPGAVANLQKLEENGFGASYAFADNSRLIFTFKPFRLDIIQDDRPVIVVNGRNLLKFEQTRTKDEKTEETTTEATPNPDDEDNADKEETAAAPAADTGSNPEEEADMWDETFKGHQDSKPNGPQSVGVDVSFPGVEHVYGIPEHADNLVLKSTRDTDPYRLYNLDVFEYELYNPMALYGSVPLMIAHNEERTIGMFWLNVAETWIDIANSVTDRSLFTKMVTFMKGNNELPQIDTHWFSETGIIDVFFLLGPTPAALFQQYATLTGTTQLPPLFALGYHQSRWNYNDQEDVKGVDNNFDQHDIPLDVIWLDIEHTDGKRYFTWDGAKFPDPHDMIANLSSKGRKLVTIVDPHIKQDSSYEIHEEAKAGNFFVKDRHGSDYDGWCWPGSSHWLDFVNPAVRDYWASQYDINDYDGSSIHLHIWNDMNEPSVMNGPEVTMHKDAKHVGDLEHRDVHNLYGMLCHKATFDGLLNRVHGQQRPFVLSRGFFAGSQRYGAVWTGDNAADWAHLKISMPMVLSLNIAGITFSGADVGGFFHNPGNELLTRWYQAGTLYPFFRAHAHLDTRRREPWLLPLENMKIIRDAVRFRYKMLPYWYTLFYETEKNGMPLLRPLWVDFPKEKSLFSVEETALVGPALLVHPVTSEGATSVSVYFPGSSTTLWYDMDTYEIRYGTGFQNIPVTLSKIPVYQRGGSIVPRKERVRRSAILTRQDPVTLVVALDSRKEAEGTLYSDDYESYKYRDNHEFIYRNFKYQNHQLSSRNLVADSLSAQSNFETREWIEKILVAGLSVQPKEILLTDAAKGSEEVELTFTSNPTNNLLTIRKPGVNIAVDFNIRLIF